MAKRLQIILALFLVVTFISCNNEPSVNPNNASFNPDTIKIPDKGGRKLRGQLLYMPIYSNLPYMEKKKYDLSAILAIHNTDLKNRIKITKVDFFDTDGKLVKTFISSDKPVNPLATVIFPIPKEDQSGTGANFLVEWMADEPVNEPLVESIMKDLTGSLGLSFLSQGRVIREIQ